MGDKSIYSMSLGNLLNSCRAAPLARAVKEMKLIHIGDIHGHLVERPNVRSDGNGLLEGGLARMYTAIKNERGDSSNKSLLINTGEVSMPVD